MKLSEKLESLAMWWMAGLGVSMSDEEREANHHIANLIQSQGWNYRDFVNEHACSFLPEGEANLSLLEAEFQRTDYAD